MNYYKSILEILDGPIYGNSFENLMVRHFVELMGEKDFNEKIEIYFKGGYPDSFDSHKCEQFDLDFNQFHKSMRQTDFFNLGKGHLDMLWWNFIQISNSTYRVFRYMFDPKF